MPKPKSFKTDFRTHDKWLTFAFVLGPMAALSNLFVSYTLVPESCMRGTKMMLHVTAAASFASCLAGAFLASRIGSRFVERDPDLLHERTRWVAISATILCLASALIIVAMELPNVILRSCD
jgi:MFS family permease